MTDSKVISEGKLFVLAEKDELPCIEIAGIDLWKWMEMHKDRNVRITLEELND